MRTSSTFMLAGLLVLFVQTAAAEPIDEVLLAGTIKAAESLVFPHEDVSVSYDEAAQEIYVKFTTPASYKVNFGNFYERWRDNQWVVLQEFKKAPEIPVKRVTVQTNHHDGSGILKISHSAVHVEKYAKLPSDELWLRTATVLQRAKGSSEWKKIDY